VERGHDTGDQGRCPIQAAIEDKREFGDRKEELFSMVNLLLAHDANMWLLPRAGREGIETWMDEGA
jgi:hypothetical protein